jgi:hypothetical protein
MAVEKNHSLGSVGTGYNLRVFVVRQISLDPSKGGVVVLLLYRAGKIAGYDYLSGLSEVAQKFGASGLARLGAIFGRKCICVLDVTYLFDVHVSILSGWWA